MTTLSDVAYSINRDFSRRKDLRSQRMELLDELMKLNEYLADSRQAQQLLGTVADERTNRVLGHVTSIINKALAEIFPSSTRYITLDRKLHADKHPHINVTLNVGDGITRDMKLQSGAGLQEIVSFLYRICLLEVTGGRKFIKMDEILSGVHDDAIKIVVDFIQIFANGGFQFLIVDYRIREKIGAMYEINKVGSVATVNELLEGVEPMQYLEDIAASEGGEE